MVISCPFLKFMVTYLKSREDFIKQEARKARRESEKESKRQARRERRSPNQVSQTPMIRAISSKIASKVHDQLLNFSYLI